MKIANGEIVMGKSIANVYLGMSLETFIKIYGEDYKKVDLNNYIQLCLENARIWINKDTQCITQITVFGDFKGKIHGKIGIGNNLTDVKNVLGGCFDVFEIFAEYRLMDAEGRCYKGVCFEVEDTDDCDEATTPIEYISVYVPENVCG